MKRSNSLRSRTELASNMLHALVAGTFGVVILAIVLRAAVVLA